MTSTVQALVLGGCLLLCSAASCQTLRCDCVSACIMAQQWAVMAQQGLTVHLCWSGCYHYYYCNGECMQAVMGTLVKRFLAKQLGLQPDQIYHCAVMPCYDKKLEGSRDDFNIPGTLHSKQSCRCAMHVVHIDLQGLTRASCMLTLPVVCRN